MLVKQHSGLDRRSTFDLYFTTQNADARQQTPARFYWLERRSPSGVDPTDAQTRSRNTGLQKQAI
jgi:hypothetical protein